MAARMLAEELLRPEHETAIRRFRALKEAYDSLFCAKQGVRAAEGRAVRTDERMMFDDYLWVRKRQSELDRKAVDFACFTEAQEWNFALIRQRSEKYAGAFDRLVDLLGELDIERDPHENACASPPFLQT